MQAYTTIKTRLEGSVAFITLNRPGVRNAMNLVMIRELKSSIGSMEQLKEIRLVVISSEGNDFCAGADLNWIREGMDLSPAQLRKEGMELAGLFRAITESTRIIVTAVQGRVMGGAIGMVAASDIVLAESSATFAFSEVKLGLIPATIAPYVLRKAGYSRAGEMMLTGRTFDAEEARTAGLVHQICGTGTLHSALHKLIHSLRGNGPEAMTAIKQFLPGLLRAMNPDQLQEFTARELSRIRTSDEAMEGTSAFLEKRKPKWIEED